VLPQVTAKNVWDPYLRNSVNGGPIGAHLSTQKQKVVILFCLPTLWHINILLHVIL